ncbi:xanthine dehydrogenase [Methylocapsa palsarum]|uniref:Xanthine dehydrogenase accessory factor n=1 Tax=Methylocapsa palsarum TaxID=1612308 RepID=A0A1I3XZY6_9HYPH|nr:xanthine dehydrogenase [Methylocapsa palsarum]SFK25063.1 hypothetical protein SAMN05444581_104199 [Methylocapsa palsarum]
MRPDLFAAFLSREARPLALILGTNEIASATAVLLAWEGYSVILSHDPFPPVIRRGMSFHDALFDDRAEVDGIAGLRAETSMEIAERLSEDGCVAVTPLQLTDLLPLRTPAALIDARMQKRRVTPDLRGLGRVAVGLGPNFAVGVNCDIAVETHPAHTGELVEIGATDGPDGVPRALGGAGGERFVYSRRDGIWRTAVDVGMQVFRGFPLGRHGGAQILAPIDGSLRGIARDGAFAPAGVKLIEIDPRGRSAAWTGSDQRGRAIAEAAAKAIRTCARLRKAMATASPTRQE